MFVCSEVGDEDCGLFDAVSDVVQEPAGNAAVADAVVKGERELRDLAYGELAVDDPGLVGDAAYAEDRRLGMVDDWRRAVDAEDTVVVEGVGAPRSGDAGKAWALLAGRSGCAVHCVDRQPGRLHLPCGAVLHADGRAIAGSAAPGVSHA